MADDDGSPRQPPQAYDTVSPAGVGATTTNQVSLGTVQEILDTHDRNLIDQAFEQMDDDALTRYLESLPDLPPQHTSSPAGVGSQGSFRSIQTSWESSPATPLSWGSARLSSGARTPLSQGSARLLTAAGAGDDGGGGGRRGGRAGGRAGGRGGGGAAAGGGGGGGRRRRGRRPRRIRGRRRRTPV